MRTYPEMYEHWRKLESLLGLVIDGGKGSGKSLQGLIRDQKMLPNHRMRWCTRILKIEPFNLHLHKNAPATSYIGLRADEESRKGTTWTAMVVPRWHRTHVSHCVQWGWGINEVKEYLREKGVRLWNGLTVRVLLRRVIGGNLWQ